MIIERIMAEPDGSRRRNVQRMRRIGRMTSRRKYLAADLIEKALDDHEDHDMTGKYPRPLHQQMADMRMSWWGARN